MAAPHKRPRLAAQEDLFSQLPRDCHLAIFLLLERKTLDELECVSRHIREIIDCRSLIGKKFKGTLTISQFYSRAFSLGDLRHRSTHEFIFALDKSPRRLCYCIFRGEKEGKRTIKTTSRSSYYVSLAKATAVPAAMFDNLHVLARKHTINNCTLNRIFVNSLFLEQILPLLSENSKNTLHFRDVAFDKSLDMKKFSELILAANLQCLRIDHTVSTIKITLFLGIFDEQFLTAFAANCGPSPTFELDVFQGMKRVPFYWTPSKVFLRVLSCFDDLSILTMKLLPEHFVEVILMRLDTVGLKKIKWTFSLVAEVTKIHLKTIDQTKYTCTEHHPVYCDNDCDCDGERDWREITKIGTAKSCRFTRYLYVDEWRVDLQFVEKYRIPKVRANY